MSDDVAIDTDFQAQIDRARRAGELLNHTEPFAVKAWYESADKLVFIELQNGVVMGFPPELLQGLEAATEDQLAQVELTATGYGLHWETLDVDLGVPQLVSGLYGTKQWMQTINSRRSTLQNPIS